MAIPKSNVKWTKNGITFEEGIDRAQYTINELIRAANRDVGKFVCRTARRNLAKRTGKGRRVIQYWSRKDGSLQVGYKGGIAGFYAAMYELGTVKTPKLLLLTDAVEGHIDEIRKIQGQYLSAIEDENKAAGLIDEGEEVSDDDDV